MSLTHQHSLTVLHSFPERSSSGRNSGLLLKLGRAQQPITKVSVHFICEALKHNKFDNFLAKRVLYNMPKLCGDVEISSSFYVLLLS